MTVAPDKPPGRRARGRASPREAQRTRPAGFGGATGHPVTGPVGAGQSQRKRQGKPGTYAPVECRALTSPTALAARTCSAPRTPTSDHRRDYGERMSRTSRHGAQVRYLDIVDSWRRLAQAFDLMKRASSQRGGRSRQTQLALFRMGRPWPAKNGVRAPMASAGLGDLPATSPIIIRWSAKSGGAGEPSGALWRPHGRPPRPPGGPHALGRSRRPVPGRERG